jgi:uncharacterized protein
MSELLPLFPLSTVLFPGMRLPLHVFEERYRLLAAHLQAQPEPRRFGVIAIRKGREVGADGITALHDVGCVAQVRQIAPHPDGRFDLATVGAERFRLLRVDDSLPYFQGEIEPLPEQELPVQTADEASLGSALAFVTQRVQAGFRGYLNVLADRGGGVVNVADLPDEPLLLSYVVGAAMIIDLPERQSLLAAPTALDRLRLERSLLGRETAMFRATTSRPAPDFGYEQFSQNLRRRRPDQLELDVVRVAEDHRGVGEGRLLIAHAGVLHAELVQPRRPRGQLLAAGDAEGHVVQAGAALVEALARVARVDVQPDDDARPRLDEQHGVAGVLPLVVREGDRQPAHPEHPLVPRHARLEVGDGRGEVIESCEAGPCVLRHDNPPA